MKKSIHLLLAVAALLAVACQPRQQEAEGPVTPLAQMPSVKDVAMYQVNPRVFAPEKSLLAVADRLDSIRALGVNVMWIMPIYPIGVEKGKNSPYCISDYKAIAPEFGTLEDFKHLISECHKRKMGVILDWVANHTAWDHPWVKDHPDWYTHDAQTDTIIHPAGTNWTDVADLNYDNQQMRQAMIDAMKYWVSDVGIDGFRCDVADGVPADFWQQAIDTLRQVAATSILASEETAESSDSVAPRQLLMLAEGRRADNFAAGFDMNYAWDFNNALISVFRDSVPASSLFAVDKAEYDSLPSDKVKLRFTTNHDESTKQTPPVLFNTLRGSMAAFVAATFLHGGMLVYGSQEVGYPDPIGFFSYVPVDWTANPRIYRDYQMLIRAYNQSPAIRRGALIPYPMRDVLAFERVYGGDRVLVLVNVRGERVTVPTPKPWVKKDAVDLGTNFSAMLEDSVEIAPYGYFILQ